MPAYVLAHNTLVLSASEPHYPPFSIVDKNGNADGFSVELMQAALEAMDRKVSFDVHQWSLIKQELIDGELDALPLVGRTPEREAIFDFTQPYIKLYGAVFVRENDTRVQKVADLFQLRTGVMQGDNAEEFMRRNNLSENLVTTTDYEAAFLQLSKGQLDAVVVQRLVGLALIEKLNLDNIQVAINPLKEFQQEFSFAVTEGNTELLGILNEGLSVVIADGTYNRLWEKWLGILQKENTYRETILNIALYTLIVTPIILIGFYLYQKKKIHKQTLSALSYQDAILAAIPDLLFEVNGDGIFLNVWSLDKNELTFSKQHLLGRSIKEVLPANTANTIMHGLKEAVDQGSFRGQQIKLNLQDREFWYELSISMHNSDKLPRRFIILARDITRRKTNEEKLRISANVFKYAREGIMITDANCRIIEVNDSFIDITGFSRNDVLGQTPKILSSGNQTDEFYTSMWQELKDKGHWYGEITNKRKCGDSYIEFLSITTAYDEKGRVKNYVGMFFDVTLQRENQKQLEHIAHYDALTQLPNRVLLGDRLNQAMMQTSRRQQYLAVVFLDLDGFKEVNDQYGHKIGDLLLAEMARRLSEALRDGDTIARIGGDEFVAILLDLNDTEACIPFLSRLLEAASKPLEIQQKSIQLSASLGVTFYYSSKGANADLLIRQADQAMYQAKLAGKNQYHIFDIASDRILREKYESIESISLALKQQQFILHYQPKVNMRTGKMLGVEALIRWNHPQKGLLPPADFLPVLEGHSISIELGEWVIDNALLQIEAWHKLGEDIQVSVNISANHLQIPDFTQRLYEITRKHSEIHSSNLEIEVLETSALEDINHVSNVIRGCNEMGIAFSLDDFGTGYSSLSYLKRLSVSYIKIDRSFVKDMLVDPDDLSILEGIIGMATAFNLKVIAEGVKSIEHGNLLIQLGCDIAQGFHIAKPMPAEQILQWKKNWMPETEWTQQKSVNREDLPLLMAAIEHSAWIKKIIDFLYDRSSIPSEKDFHDCRFGRWLKGDGKKRYQTRASYQSIVSLHDQVHHFAKDLLALKADGEEVSNGIKDLLQYKNNLIEQMNLMLKQVH